MNDHDNISTKKFQTKHCYIFFLPLGWLVGFLWHINFCRLFNAKSIFMKIVLFQTIQFRMNTQFKRKYSLIVKNISIWSYSVYSNSSNSANLV